MDDALKRNHQSGRENFWSFWKRMLYLIREMYRMTFETAPYFAAQQLQSFYPFVQLVFEIKDTKHYHIPLLLSPYGFTTYRGSWYFLYYPLLFYSIIITFLKYNLSKFSFFDELKMFGGLGSNCLHFTKFSIRNQGIFFFLWFETFDPKQCLLNVLQVWIALWRASFTIFWLNGTRLLFALPTGIILYAEFGACVWQRFNNRSKAKDWKEIVTSEFYYDDLPTYASSYSRFFSGHTFVPINPLHPTGRNESIPNKRKSVSCWAVEWKKMPSVFRPLQLWWWKPALAMISVRFHLLSNKFLSVTLTSLFTSGSTGVPKGVPLTIHNLESFLCSIFRIRFQHWFIRSVYSNVWYDIWSSIMSYMAPLCIGACVYTVLSDGIKYMQVYRLLEDHQITFALLVPSIITHLSSVFLKKYIWRKWNILFLWWSICMKM